MEISRATFGRLQAAVGFASKVYFGRDAAVNGGLLQRVVEDDTHILYALAVADAGTHGKHGIREFRLIIAPVPVKLANGTRPPKKPAVYTKGPMSAAHKAAIKAGMKKRWAKLRAGVYRGERLGLVT